MHTLERPAASEDLGAKKARLAELQAADVEKRDLEREIAEEERRQAEERLLNAFRRLDEQARDSVAKVIALQPLTSHGERVREQVRQALGVEHAPSPDNREELLSHAGALLGAVSALVDDHAALIDKACGLGTAHRWRVDQVTLGRKIRDLRGGYAPVTRGPSTLPDDAEQLLKIARGEA